MTIVHHSDTSINKAHESFLAPFFKAMNAKFSGKWCVLHSYETLPYYSESDVDMAFSGSNLQSLERLINSVAAQMGWQLYQKLWYDVQWCCYYVLREKKTGTLLAIDFLTDNHGIGRYGFKTTALTENCNRINDLIPVPNHETALSYKLVKRIEKGRPLDEDKSYLKEHYDKADEQKIDVFLDGQYGGDGRERLVSYLRQNDSPLSNAYLISLKQERKRKMITLTTRAKFAYWETRRVCHRIRHPSGMLVNIPKLEGNMMRAFTEILKQKVSILFRFVKLESKPSILQNFKSMAGSTLIVCPQENFDSKKTVRYHGVYPKYIALDISETLTFDDLDIVADQYLTLILEALSIRISSKLHSNG